MRDSIFSAVFGALSNEMRMSTTANNLANVNTTGYKKDECAFHDTFIRFAHDYVVDAKPYMRDKPLFPEADLMSRVRLSDQYTDLAQGSLQETGNPLDLAISGDGFFKAQVGDEQQLTRAGNFSVDQNGVLVTKQGYPVMVGGGSLAIPPDATNVSIDSGGQISADGAVLGQLDIVDVDDKRALEKVGQNFMRIREDSGANEIPAENMTVEQGYLEKSNVEVVTEMVKMIETQRAFQSYQKVMTSTDQIDRRMIMTLGRSY